MSLSKAKIALVFDWMTSPGGAERVNLMLHRMFPDAPIFTSIFDSRRIQGFESALVNTSFIQNLPFSKSRHQFYLGLMPYAYELFDLSQFDIVISSSHSCAKGIITKPETLHVCYCHSPMRYAWDNWHSYIREYRMNPILKSIGKKRIHKIRLWDRISADRPDYYIANSQITKHRIEKYYKRASSVINPMVDTKRFKIAPKTKGYFLAIGRLIPYKKFDLIIDTFNQTGLPLKIVGTGVSESELQARANANIDFLGYVPDEQLPQLYAEAEALIFPQLEDFGIIALESMASGRPVIAYQGGGALETVIPGKTGIFFEKQTPADLKAALEEFQKIKRQFKPAEIRAHAEQYDNKAFQKKFMDYLREKWKNHQSTGN